MKRKLQFAAFGTMLCTCALLLSGCGGASSVNGISASSLASNYVSGSSRSILRINGLDAYDGSGQPITLGQFARNYLNLLNSKFAASGQPSASSSDVAVGVEPGNSLYNALNQFFTNTDAAAVVGLEMEKDAGK